MPKLGQIEKPKVSDFGKSRRLYCFPLIPNLNQNDLSDELKNNIDQFWSQGTSKLEEIEKLGNVSHLFVETITQTENSGLEMVKQLGNQCYRLVKDKIDKGAKLVDVEEEEILNELLEWSLCLSMIRKSQKVFNQIYQFLQESKKLRNTQIAKRINEILKDTDCGLLMMTDENRLEIQPILSPDIQVFLIHPPAFNDVIHGFRQLFEKQNTKP